MSLFLIIMITSGILVAFLLYKIDSIDWKDAEAYAVLVGFLTFVFSVSFGAVMFGGQS